MEEAERISDSVLSKRLAACASMIPIASSKYWWQGKLERATEILLILKTKQSAVDKLKTEILKIHSYKNPEIIVLPVSSSSNARYLDWIDENVKV